MMKKGVLPGLLALAVSLSAAPVRAEQTCPLAATAEVESAFGKSGARLLSADPSGMCAWNLADGATFVLQVQKRPTAAEAGVLFDSYRQTTFSRLAHGAATPKLGQKALLGMTPKGSERAEAGLIALDRDTLLSVSYYPAGPEVEGSVPAAIERVGRLAMGNKGAAQQSFGQCEWLASQDVDKLLGSGRQSIQRVGPNHCLAAVQPGSGSLGVMTTSGVTPRVMANMLESAREGCKVAMLPEFGAEAYAAYACPAPGNKALTIYFLKNGTQAMVVFGPTGGRAATAADVDALRPLASRVFEKL